MIVITGAAGLIGCAVARELNRRGLDDLLLVDHCGETDKWMNMRSLRFRRYLEKDDFLEFMEGRRNFADLRPEQIRAVIHLGACSATTEKDATYLMKNNYEYSVRIADFCARADARLVYASSAATYGEGENGYEDDESQMEKLRPLNPYGYSKQMFDLWLKRNDFAPGAAGIKYFNIFGPNEYHKGDMMSVVLKAFRQIRDEGMIRLFKSYRPEYRDGEQKRDFLYVEDAARMTVYLTLDNREARGVFNAGCGEPNTWLTLTGAIFEAMGKKPNIEFIDMPEYIRERYQYYTCAPMDKLRGIGYTAPPTPLQDAVHDYVKNYLIPGELRA